MTVVPVASAGYSRINGRSENGDAYTRDVVLHVVVVVLDGQRSRAAGVMEHGWLGHERFQTHVEVVVRTASELGPVHEKRRPRVGVEEQIVADPFDWTARNFDIECRFTLVESDHITVEKIRKPTQAHSSWSPPEAVGFTLSLEPVRDQSVTRLLL